MWAGRVKRSNLAGKVFQEMEGTNAGTRRGGDERADCLAEEGRNLAKFTKWAANIYSKGKEKNAPNHRRHRVEPHNGHRDAVFQQVQTNRETKFRIAVIVQQHPKKERDRGGK